MDKECYNRNWRKRSCSLKCPFEYQCRKYAKKRHELRFYYARMVEKCYNSGDEKHALIYSERYEEIKENELRQKIK